LHYAATKGDIPMIELLLDNDAYIDAESPNGTTPLMMAAQYGTPTAVKALLEAGADPSLKNGLGLSAIDFANRVSRADVAEVIARQIKAKQPKGTW
jgi:ankyrin repeat protein